MNEIANAFYPIHFAVFCIYIFLENDLYFKENFLSEQLNTVFAV